METREIPTKAYSAGILGAADQGKAVGATSWRANTHTHTHTHTHTYLCAQRCGKWWCSACVLVSSSWPLIFLPGRKGTGTGGTALKVNGQHGVGNVPLPLLASRACLAFPEAELETYTTEYIPINIHVCLIYMCERVYECVCVCV